MSCHDKQLDSEPHGGNSSESDLDSLFEESIGNTVPVGAGTSSLNYLTEVPAMLSGPPIPGLHFDPHVLLPAELVEEVMQKCISTYFPDSKVNQIMLFERADTLGQPESEGITSLPLTCFQNILFTRQAFRLASTPHCLRFSWIFSAYFLSL